MSLDTSLSHEPLGSLRLRLVATTALVLVALVAILADQALTVAAAMVLVPLGLVVLARPHYLIPAVVFVLYSNAAVVAVRFHNVPSAAAMLIPALLTIPLFFSIVIYRQKLIFTGSLPLIALFVFIQLLGVLGARYRDLAWAAAQISITEGLLLYVLVTNVVRNKERVIQATWALLLAGSFMGGLSLLQQVTGTFHDDFGGFAQVTSRGFHVQAGAAELRQPRLCGPIGEQNRYAQIMLMLVPLGLYQFWGEPNAERKWLAAAAAALSAIGCALAFSRGAAVGFVLMLFLMTGMRQLPLRHLLLFAAGVALLLIGSPQYRTRLASLVELAEMATTGNTSSGELDGAIRGRATVMLAAARVTADYPLLGVGPAMFNFYSRDYGIEGGLRALEGTREAHSLYLEIAAEHGLIGLACFLTFVGVSLNNLRRARRACQSRDPQLAYLATAYLLAIATYLCTGLFLHFSYARYFWLVLALADATSYVSGQTASRDTMRNASAPATDGQRALEAAPC